MDWEVVWSESALAGVEAAIRYVAQFSQDTAEELRAALFASADVLARFPEIGAIYEADDANHTREITCRKYRIFYRPDHLKRQVSIILVWHSSRHEPQLPK